jgi:ssDNA-binding Zn-finger/Zn-ribbon topoisomerase 1
MAESQPSQSGDDCPKCDGHLVIYSTHRQGELCVRYLQCWKCKAAPVDGKRVVNASEVPNRRPRKTASADKSTPSKRLRTNNVNAPLANMAEALRELQHAD